MINDIRNYFLESISLKEKILGDSSFLNQLVLIVNEIIECYSRGNKILICGNGGSAADSQHFAAELVGRYKLNRKPLPAISLTTDTSNITAIGNDFGFETVFERQVEALGKSGDLLVSISTSGNSVNCVNAIKKAKEQNIKTISLLGNSGGKIKDISDYSLIVSSNNTPRIQELHIMLIHIICELIEIKLFKNE